MYVMIFYNTENPRDEMNLYTNRKPGKKSAKYSRLTSSRRVWCLYSYLVHACTHSGEGGGGSLTRFFLCIIFRFCVYHGRELGFIDEDLSGRRSILVKSGRETSTEYQLPAMLAREKVFRRTVQDCTLSLIYLFWMYLMFVILPRPNCTQVETRLLRRAPPTLRQSRNYMVVFLWMLTSICNIIQYRKAHFSSALTIPSRMPDRDSNPEPTDTLQLAIGRRSTIPARAKAKLKQTSR